MLRRVSMDFFPVFNGGQPPEHEPKSFRTRLGSKALGCATLEENLTYFLFPFFLLFWARKKFLELLWESYSTSKRSTFIHTGAKGVAACTRWDIHHKTLFL